MDGAPMKHLQNTPNRLERLIYMGPLLTFKMNYIQSNQCCEDGCHTAELTSYLLHYT